MKPILWHVEARAEVQAAILYYNTQRVSLGAEFRAELGRSFRRIKSNPSSFSKVGGLHTRKCLMKRFPYAIYFMELQTAMFIPAVAHHRRQPGYWINRTPD